MNRGARVVAQQPSERDLLILLQVVGRQLPGYETVVDGSSRRPASRLDEVQCSHGRDGLADRSGLKQRVERHDVGLPRLLDAVGLGPDQLCWSNTATLSPGSCTAPSSAAASAAMARALPAQRRRSPVQPPRSLRHAWDRRATRSPNAAGCADATRPAESKASVSSQLRIRCVFVLRPSSFVSPSSVLQQLLHLVHHPVHLLDGRSSGSLVVMSTPASFSRSTAYSTRRRPGMPGSA